jgi:hypothetical protein
LISDSDNNYTAEVRFDVDRPGHENQQKANANRIVACVNVCAGIPTADLLAQPTVSQTVLRIAELVAAAEEAEAVLDEINDDITLLPDSLAITRVSYRLRAAIAAMKEMQ